MDDTIAILRGLKEKFEIHHGVRIKDAAIIAAAVLCHRYIADRFLPDKAIDLIDEAGSALRLQIGSMPIEIDDLDRRISHLEIERQALSKEKDAGQPRTAAPRGERTGDGCARKAATLKERWNREKSAIGACAPPQGRAGPVAHGRREGQPRRRLGEGRAVALRAPEPRSRRTSRPPSRTWNR